MRSKCFNDRIEMPGRMRALVKGGQGKTAITSVSVSQLSLAGAAVEVKELPTHPNLSATRAVINFSCGVI